MPETDVVANRLRCLVAEVYEECGSVEDTEQAVQRAARDIVAGQCGATYGSGEYLIVCFKEANHDGEHRGLGAVSQGWPNEEDHFCAACPHAKTGEGMG